MTSIFAALLYRPDAFSASLVTEHLSAGRDPLPGERCVDVAVTDDVRAVLYDPGLVSSPMVAFSVSADQFLANDILTAVAARARAASGDFTFFSRLYSREAGFDVVEKYARDEFQGRLIVEGLGESITLKGGAREYSSGNAADGDYSPGAFLERELGVDDAAFLAALQKADQGTMLWPAELRTAGEPWDSNSGEAQVPLPPFWKDLSTDFLNL